jgi:hypothetical protein
MMEGRIEEGIKRSMLERIKRNSGKERRRKREGIEGRGNSGKVRER